MAKLILTLGETVLREYALRPGSQSIGRAPGNDIQPEDPTISKKHALVTVGDGGVVVEDLKSTNGTLVNGKKITRCALRDGDIIEIGRHRLRYVQENEWQPEVLTDSELATSAALSAKGAPVASLRMLDGSEAGKIVDLSRAYTPVGRLGVDVAVITRRTDGYFIVNLGGNKGRALVSGQPVGVKGQALRSHDIVEAGGVRMEFVLKS
jgi:hypothetical protein